MVRALRKNCLPITATVMGVLLLSGCSAAPDKYEAGEQSRATPDIAPGAAPGVAFNYAYRFALAAPEIATVQEKHAAACEALGLNRCRVTGLSFRRVGADDVDATLKLVLDPTLARRFGRDASALVEADKGVVSAVDIGAEDMSRAIAQGDSAAQAAQAEQARLKEAAKATTDRGRADLEQQISDAQARERSASANAQQARAADALTPMQFDYSTNDFIPGFSLQGTALGALAFAAWMLNGLFAILIVLISIAIPLGILLLGGSHVWAWLSHLWQKLSPKRPALPE